MVGGTSLHRSGIFYEILLPVGSRGIKLGSRFNFRDCGNIWYHQFYIVPHMFLECLIGIVRYQRRLVRIDSSNRYATLLQLTSTWDAAGIRRISGMSVQHCSASMKYGSRRRIRGPLLTTLQRTQCITNWTLEARQRVSSSDGSVCISSWNCLHMTL